MASITSPRAPGGRVGGRARAGVVERAGERLERVVEDRDDRLERLQGALRAARQVDDQRPAADADDDRADRAANGVVRAALGAHRLGEPGHLVVEHVERRLGRDVARASGRCRRS